MKPSDLQLGRETQYNVLTNKNLPARVQGQFIDCVVIKEEVYANIDGQLHKLDFKEDQLKMFITSFEYDRENFLIRIDTIMQHQLIITSFVFANGLTIKEESLKLVLTKDLDLSLRKTNIPTSNLVDFLEKEFLIKPYAFSYASQDLKQITLIGKSYEITFVQNSQRVLIAQEIKRLSRNVATKNIALVTGTIEFQENLHNAQVSVQLEREYETSVQDNEELLALWGLYGELEMESNDEDCEAMGLLTYTSFIHTINAKQKRCIKFVVTSSPTERFKQSGSGYAVNTIGGPTDKEKFIGSKIDKIERISADEHHITVFYDNVNALPPSEGILKGSRMGSKIMNDRRQSALNTILSGRGALPSLKYIIQLGSGTESVQKVHKAITDRTIKKVFRDKPMNFTLVQEDAIFAAINTADIAIIQGPPGTGKTTIIHAIVERITALNSGTPNILISSAQHDAVDNAIEHMSFGGLPAYRMGGKMGEERTQQTRNVLTWLDNVNSTTEKFIEKQESHLEHKIIRQLFSLLQDIHIYKEQHKTVLLKSKDMYPLLQQLQINQSVVEELEQLIKFLEFGPIMITSSTDDDADEWQTLLRSQVYTVDAFKEEGKQQLMSLMRYCRMEKEDFEVPDIWMDLRLADDDKELEQLLPEFEPTIECLLDPIEEPIEYVAEDIIDTHLESITKLLKEYIANKPKTLVDVLQQFQDDLESPKNIREILEKYTKIKASTCQQSLPKKNRTTIKEVIYDYVIIDEAARANPLDLLIPMSLGKKIILVGDHKQLPHILESEIVQKVLKKKDNPEYEGLLKSSLFDRLFNLLEDTSTTYGIRTVMLTEQYRMHPTIGKFVSDTFYDSDLRNGVTEEQRLSNVTRYARKPIAWLDVPYEKGAEQGGGKQSTYRPAEVEKLQLELYQLLQETTTDTIGIITFYKKQMTLIEELIEQLPAEERKRVEVGTVDSFQGKEFDIVILSTVRSNKQKNVGFVSNTNRLNVAFSRAKKILVVIGDRETISGPAEKPVIEAFSKFELLCKEEGYYE